MTSMTEVPNIPPEKLTAELLRSWSWNRQGLDGALAGESPAAVLSKAGWARSVGGANTYLTLFARAGTRREAVDQQVAERGIHELPAARGCTYVLPAADYAWGLQVGRGAAEAEVKVLGRLGVERAEIVQLAEHVWAALSAAAADGQPSMDPRELKEVLGAKVRNMGEEGKKKGSSTTLPAALGLLQAEGRIRRVPVNGRLDQQRYSYAAWDLGATDGDDESVRARLVEHYLGWTGGATLGQLRWFTAFTVAQSKKALGAVGALEVATAGGETLWLLPADAARLASFEPSGSEDIQLLSGSDSLVLLRRNSSELFDEAGAAAVHGMTGSALAADLSDHPIFDRGRIIGLWQYDPENTRIAWWTFGAASAAVLDRIAVVEAWIRDDLGDFRSFSLDSPKSRAKNIAKLDGLRGA